jgi:hypothetical protein
VDDAGVLLADPVRMWRQVTQPDSDDGHDGKESKGEDDGGGGRPVPPPLLLQLPKALEGGKLDLHAVLAHGDRVPRLILDLLLPAACLATLESVRVASKGGWMFIERNLRTALVDGLLSPETMCGKLYKKWLKSSPTAAPATGAEMLALCRGLQKKAVMINLVNELKVTGVDVDVPLKEWKGVTMGADGQVVKIDFSQRCKGGAVDKIVLPEGMQEVILWGCGFGLTGAVDKLLLPEGMQSVDFRYCQGLKGAVDKLVLPDGMQSVVISWCDGLTGDIGQMKLPVGMKTVNFEKCRGLTAPPGCPRGSSYDSYYNEDDLNRLRSWISLTATQGGAAGEDVNDGPGGGGGEGATEMEALRAFAESVGYKGDIMDGVVTECAGGAIEEIRWKEKYLDGTLPKGDLNMPKLRVLDLYDNTRLEGDVTQLRLPDGMQSLILSGSPIGDPMHFITGDIGQMNLPVGMKTVDFEHCAGITGAVDKLVLPEGMQTVILCLCKGVTGDIGQMNLPVGMKTVNFCYCEGITGELPASERAKVKNYASPRGY